MNKTKFLILIEPEAINDIQLAIDYYDEAQIGLGKKFEYGLNKLLTNLEHSPFYAIRYDDVLCLPMRKFPFMIHYTINEEKMVIIVRAVFHTSLNPDKWKR